MVLKSLKPFSDRHPSMLVCSAYNFYPKPILVTWLRDGEEITTDVSDTQVLSDGDFYYQIHSFLEFTPTSGETITCMVEHPSLTEPMFQHWGKRVLGRVYGICTMITCIYTCSACMIFEQSFMISLVQNLPQ